MIFYNICISISGLQLIFVIFLEIFLMVLIMQEILYPKEYETDIATYRFRFEYGVK